MLRVLLRACGEGRQKKLRPWNLLFTHTQSIGWGLHFIISPHCQEMQVKIETMSHLPFRCFFTHPFVRSHSEHQPCQSFRPCCSPRASISRRGVLLGLLPAAPPHRVWQTSRCLRPRGFGGHIVGLWSCAGYHRISLYAVRTRHNSPAWLQSSTLGPHISHTRDEGVTASVG